MIRSSFFSFLRGEKGIQERKEKQGIIKIKTFLEDEWFITS